MIRIPLIFLLFLLLCSCSQAFYQKVNPVQTTGLDFSKGKWLLGNIEVHAYVKDELTELVLKDFSEHLKERISYSLREKSLFLASKIPLNPTKSAILDLKTGTGYDYYINIKCQDQRSDLSNFDFSAHSYYLKQMTYGRVFMEVYDLNQGIIVYQQGIDGSMDEDSGLSTRPKRKILLGCYAKLMKDINSRSLGIHH
ncbi:hypothetical protein [Flavobacterium sp.]|uniref:hypothetical protein n=1 Tax=Flavobacterium sp. TaxID=239 RepID=UPI003D6B3D16